MAANKNIYLILVVIVIILLAGCTLPAPPPNTNSDTQGEVGESPTRVPGNTQALSSEDREVFDRLQPENLVYLGAFRLPEVSGEINWDYSGQALTYFPAGDPGGAGDGFPGSLFGVGHDQYLLVSEISIPAPVISDNLEDLNTAVTLQPFADATAGIFDAQEMVIPVVGIEYLTDLGGGSGKLYFAWGQHIQDLEPSHGWGDIDLSANHAEGPYVFGNYTNYITSDYLFAIPEEWSAQYAPGMRLASGRFREGVWGGMGPALLAYDPDSVAGGQIGAITPLLVYGIPREDGSGVDSEPSMQMVTYQESDRWSGGAWLTSAEGDAVVFVGTKATGTSWYGFANGVVWPHDCAEHQPSTCPEVPEWPYEDRGYWAEGYQAQMIFYDTNELGQVAAGELEPYQPQPYAVLDLRPYLFDPNLNYEDYKREMVGALAFDSARGYIYLVERLADEYRSVIHVFQIESGQ